MKLNQLLKKRLHFLVIVLFPMLANAQQFGSIDPSFNIGEGPKNAYAGGAEGQVRTIKLAADGNIVIGGHFRRYNYADKKYLVKITPDGRALHDFNPPVTAPLNYSGTGEAIYQVNPLSNGKFLVKGILLNGSQSNNHENGIDRVYRINANGTLDESFTINGEYYGRELKNLILQPDGKVIFGSYPFARTLANGNPDPSFATNLPTPYRVLASELLSDGKILAAVQSGNDTRIYRLLTNGRIDTNYSLNARANGAINVIKKLNNGKFIVVGDFTNYNGVALNRIFRLNADGSYDNTFNSNAGFDAKVTVIQELTDSTLIIGGDFSSYNNFPAKCIVKLNSDGSRFAAFNAQVSAFNNQFSRVNDILVLSTGRILIGGQFNFVNNNRVNNVGALNADGTTDDSFNNHITVLPRITKVIKVPNSGKWIVAGRFDTFNGFKTFGVARLNANGSVDTTFKHNPTIEPSFYTFENVTDLEYDAEGNLYVIANAFNKFGISSQYGDFNYSAALNSNGSLKENSIVSRIGITGYYSTIVGPIKMYPGNRVVLFGAGPLMGDINSATATYHFGMQRSLKFSDNQRRLFVAQDDYNNKTLIGGNFTSVYDTPNNGVFRINPNGQLDNTFSSASGANNAIKLIFPLTTGEYLVGGNFDFYAGVRRRGLAKINNSGTFIESFNAGAGFQISGPNSAELLAGVSLPNNQILVAGNFTQFNGNVTNRITCLDANGNTVTNFQTTGSNNTIYALGQQLDGDILVGGEFTAFNDLPVNYLVKIRGNGTPLSANIEKGKLPIQVYPNPAKDKLTIVSENGIGTITISDSQGKQVLTQTIDGTTTLSIGDLSAGIYTLRLETAQGVAIQKVVKQ